ncbi:hypothetical protein NDU88_004623 [Pleurodeles waltl]|uniref:Uncharacterized protein n=1 Tax=Pleurodeles waltl TaxID=8319 RepID=A0AAV7RG88_PLEWA|nr:hypothetical protein NDU88_004623 [Pleurodeles waltl]
MAPGQRGGPDIPISSPCMSPAHCAKEPPSAAATAMALRGIGGSPAPSRGFSQGSSLRQEAGAGVRGILGQRPQRGKQRQQRQRFCGRPAKEKAQPCVGGCRAHGERKIEIRESQCRTLEGVPAC